MFSSNCAAFFGHFSETEKKKLNFANNAIKFKLKKAELEYVANFKMVLKNLN